METTQDILNDAKMVTNTKTHRLIYFKGFNKIPFSAMICQVCMGWETFTLFFQG